MKAVHEVYRQEFLKPLLVPLFLFQVADGMYLAAHAEVQPMDRFCTFEIAAGIFLATCVLGD